MHFWIYQYAVENVINCWVAFEFVKQSPSGGFELEDSNGFSKNKEIIRIIELK